MSHHLLRVGVLGNVGRFASADAVRYPRGTRVIARTVRGLETAEVLSHAAATQGEPDGLILRGMTVEDDLLDARLRKNRSEALAACEDRIRQHGLSADLLDVEHLFDGESLYFYFLGDAPPELAGLTAELASLYEAQVQFRRFSEAVETGCGPGCGTDEATGHCGTSYATSCAIAGACGTRKS
ncbi:MAG: PSP1 C-terminal domain-containing protein [Pirellulales bacterium]